ncbi:hypothetical protein PFLmoz3_06023 [Pseudomonas fluorescens]|uniref:Uncharacterized protein n=1 Tax=Pseudomonas fluorescens TaxID=294 RepID=A0A109LAJ6_PSEFL|nr:hypothetical protein PFLmoz3_06023 [Pseudomonas fluorescens]
MALEQLQAPSVFGWIIQQLSFQQSRVSLADVSRLHTPAEQVVSQPTGRRGVVQRDAGDGVREPGQVFQRQFGQAYGDQVDFTRYETSRHRHCGGNHPFKGQLNIGRQHFARRWLSVQASFERVIGKLTDRVDTVEILFSAILLAGHHQRLEQARIGDAVLLVGVGQPQRHGAAQRLLTCAQAGDEPASRIGDVVEQRLMLPRCKCQAAVNPVDIAQLTCQVARRQGVERIAVNVLGKPLLYARALSKSRQPCSDFVLVAQRVQATGRAEQQALLSVNKDQHRQHLDGRPRQVNRLHPQCIAVGAPLVIRTNRMQQGFGEQCGELLFAVSRRLG